MSDKDMSGNICNGGNLSIRCDSVHERDWGGYVLYIYGKRNGYDQFDIPVRLFDGV